MVVFPVFQLPPFLSPAHVAIRSGSFSPSAVCELPASRWLDLWLSAVSWDSQGSACLGSYGRIETGLLVHLAELVRHLLGPVAWKKKKVKYQGQYADHIFILIQIQNFSHGACCELFKGKKAEIILELAREGGPQGGCNMPEQSEVLFRRGCACMPGRSHDREWLSGAPVSPKSSLILPNQG